MICSTNERAAPSSSLSTGRVESEKSSRSDTYTRYPCERSTCGIASELSELSFSVSV